MSPRSLSLAALAAGALLLPAAAPAGAQAASACANLAPLDVKLKPNATGERVTVSWRVPGGHPAKLAYRVARGGAVVGQTSGRRMQVRVRANRAAKITVTAVVAGRKTHCKATVRLKAGTGSLQPARSGGPGPVQGLSVTPRGKRSVRLAWDAAARGKRPVAGYRLLRDGRVVRKTAGRSLKLKAGRRAQRFQVAAADTRGRLGARSGTVIVKRGHVAPTTPAAPAVSEVTDSSALLSWRSSRAFKTRIAGYRLIRDGRTVRGVQATNLRLTGLASLRTQTYKVVAVDSFGWTSRASESVRFQTGHTAPAAPAAPYATSVSATALSLAWKPGALPAGSKLRGYRVMRDGKVVAQVPAAQANIGNLAPKSTHDWTIATVDTLGYVSVPSPAARIVQTDPPAATGTAQAFLLASTSASFTAFRKHYSQIGVVYPTFYDCNLTSGRIGGRNDEQIVTFAKDRKVKVLPRFNCQSDAILHRILTEPGLRSHWLDTITSLVVQNGWDGVNIDFEAGAPEDRDNLSAFIADLADRLHARGKLLSQAVSAKTEDVADHPRSTFFDYNALSRHNDYVFVMAWGVHWATSAPGAQDDYPWVKQVVDYVSALPRKEKYVMGTMLYGMDWPNRGGSDNPAQGLHFSEIQALAARYGVAPTFDPTARSWVLRYNAGGTPREVWYSDAGAVGDRVALARDRGLGVGFWRIGQEDERIWSHTRLQG